MPIQRIILKGYPYQNIDGTELVQQPERLVDGYVDEAGAYVKRPGLSKFADLGTSAEVKGMYYWAENDVVVAVSDQNIYKIDSSGNVTNITGDQLTGLNRPTFAEVVNGDGSHHLAMADGGRIVSWDGTGTTTLMADPDAPTSVTFVAFIDGYLLANNGNNKFYWSDLNDFDSWTATSFASAETKNDNIDAIIVQNREIFLIGKQSIEVWYSTGDNTVFARKLGAEIEDGCIAPYSIQTLDGALIYLNKDKRVKMLVGRTLKTISTAIDKKLAEYTTVTDAIGDILQVGGRGFYILSFPTENETRVYDYQSNGWCEWAYWNPVNSAYDRYRGSCILYVPQWGKHLVGDKSNGKIYTTDPSYYDDDGEIIRFLLRTGHVNHNADVRKRTNRMIFKFKRGVAVSPSVVSHGGNTYTCIKTHVADSTNEPGVGANWQTYWSQTGSGGSTWTSGTRYVKGITAPQIAIRWKDEGGTWGETAYGSVWGNETSHSLGLGETGQDDFYVCLYRLGIYRSRQYEIVHTDESELRFIGMEETFDWMTS